MKTNTQNNINEQNTTNAFAHKDAKQLNIKVPEYLTEMSDEGQKKAIGRRVAKAQADAPKRRRRLAGGILALAALVVCMTAMLAKPTDPVEAEVVTKTVVIHDRAAWSLTAEDADVVCRVVSAVAKGEPKLAQEAVAQSLRNAMESNECSVQDVIDWGKYPVDDTYTEEIAAAVSRVMEGYNAIDAKILFSYNPAVQSGEWHEAQNFVCQIGNLKFFG